MADFNGRSDNTDVIPLRARKLTTETSYRQQVERNSKEIVNLRRRIREARHFGDEAEWRDACRDFHDKYELLAFPGGARGARHRLREGDANSIEYAIAFLEIRPYFFRSGYMYKEFMRVLRNCQLSDSQRKRYDFVREKYLLYRRNRRRT